MTKDERTKLLEELCKVRKEYTELLGNIVRGWGGYMAVHGIHDSEENIQKGAKLRQQIAELENKLK